MLPLVGQLVKMRLNRPLDGPGSEYLSSAAPTRATVHNYRTAVVVSVRNDAHLQRLMVTVYPIPAYTGAQLLGMDSQGWVAQLPETKRRQLVPMPYVGHEDGENLKTIPEGFGEPVRPLSANGGGYVDRVPRWILVEEHVVHLAWTAMWKSFHPDVRFTTSDLDRLQSYASRLQIISHQSNPNSNLGVNMLQTPEEYSHPRGIFEEVLDGFRGVVHYLPEDGEDEEVDGGIDEDQDEPGVGGWLDLVLGRQMRGQ